MSWWRTWPPAAPARPGAHAAPAAHGTAHARPAPHGARAGKAKEPTPEEIHQQNVQNLTRILYQEARGQHRLGMEAVGSTIRNRMQRNGAQYVTQVWGAYSHGVPVPKRPEDRAALQEARQVAEDILNGTVKDPTSGATHYYSPQLMPKKGEPTRNADVQGGLETVPGVTNKDGQPARNYRPSFARDWPEIIVPDLSPRDFRFYRQPEDRSRVH